MRTLCVIFGAVLMLFTGVFIIHHQQDFREAKFNKIPALQNWFNGPKADKDFSVSSLEPRSLID